MYITYIIIFISLCNGINCELLQYFKNIGSYFGYKQDVREAYGDDILDQNIPYEVSIADEKFISEAAKLTGVVLSELDSCQHKVVLKLQTSCERMNDEQLAKMAVMLLNCQSSVEGRTIYPCTDTMSIKDCTSSMDADTWNTYHLMSNRARAVCYAVRQIQFRGLTEYTINKLMSASRDQLFNLDKLAKDQKSLQEITEQSLNSVTQGQERLALQQKDFQMAQLHGQLSIEDNLKRLVDEKRLISETHKELTDMTRSVQDKLEEAASQLKSHIKESRLNHKQLLDDLIAIHNKAQTIFQRIGDSSELLLKQSEIVHKQYEITVKQLGEVNATVHSLVTLIGCTRKALEEQLIWINTALGGTDLAIGRLYAILWHILFLLVAMIICAFLSASIISRCIVISTVPLNLAMVLHQSEHALDPFKLIITIIGFIFVQSLIFSSVVLWRNNVPQQILPWIRKRLQRGTNIQLNQDNIYKEVYKYKSNIIPENATYDTDELESNISHASTSLRGRDSPLRSRNVTPFILNGAKKVFCGAKTRLGTPCKLSVLPGREYCYRHQSGDSIYAG